MGSDLKYVLLGEGVGAPELHGMSGSTRKVGWGGDGGERAPRKVDQFGSYGGERGVQLELSEAVEGMGRESILEVMGVGPMCGGEGMGHLGEAPFKGKLRVKGRSEGSREADRH